ncbi:MAG: phospho-N-acetylmuramoyl-pentapeptide-transferase [Candidatus Blackburnbacteria bacterium]|nr:phospho-N-acetylmuramoyl-pentapeptide-transferase [Candidatus Blackburnbacteria bacterium]
MSTPSILPLALGLVIFSFLITGILVVPFIDLLYKLKLTRRREAPTKGKVPLFDRLHDIKVGTPVGGGILLILVVSLLFAAVFPLASYLGVFVQSAYVLRTELFVIFFTFISFGLLGLSDDLVKMFGKPRQGSVGMWVGLSRRSKFVVQWMLAFAIGFVIYRDLGIHIFHVPFVGKVFDLGIFYVPFSAFMIVAFTNAFNITDGLDGLASGLLMICLIAFGVIAAGSLDTPLSIFIALWLGALLAFLYFNVWPARIFLGDAGSLSFGATLAVLGILTGSIIALVIIGGVFVVEIVSALIQMMGWRFLKRPIFPLAPLHNTLLAIGWEEPKIVARAWLAGIILAVFGLWLSFM